MTANIDSKIITECSQKEVIEQSINTSLLFVIKDIFTDIEKAKIIEQRECNSGREVEVVILDPIENMEEVPEKLNSTNEKESKLVNSNPSLQPDGPIVIDLTDSQNEDSSTEAKNVPEEEPSKEKEVRWGRKMDKDLFAAIREMQKDDPAVLDRLLQMKITYQDTHFPEVRHLMKCCSWKGRQKNIVKRIQLLHKRQRMSSREKKLLKKLIRKYYLGKEVDYQSLIYNFPGKTIETLKSAVEGTKIVYYLKAQVEPEVSQSQPSPQ